MSTKHEVIDRTKFWNRFVALGLLSLFLYTTIFLAGAAFAPLVIALLTFGRKLGLTLAVCCIGTLAALSPFMDVSPYAIAGYGIMVAIGYLTYELFSRDIAPDKAYCFIAIVVAIFFTLCFLFAAISQGNSYEAVANGMLDNLVASINQNGQQQGAGEFVKMLREGEIFGQKVKYFIPGYLFISFSVYIWIGILMVLRFAPGWRRSVGYHHSLKEFFEYRNPEFMVIPFILSLAGLLGGHYGEIQLLSIISGNALMFISVFYFFHGLGVYHSFLKYLRFGGLLKTVFFVFGFLALNRILIIIGIFDYWVNFRKFFKKQKEL